MLRHCCYSASRHYPLTEAVSESTNCCVAQKNNSLFCRTNTRTHKLTALPYLLGDDTLQVISCSLLLVLCCCSCRCSFCCCSLWHRATMLLLSRATDLLATSAPSDNIWGAPTLPGKPKLATEGTSPKATVVIRRRRTPRGRFLVRLAAVVDAVSIVVVTATATQQCSVMS